MRIQALWDKHAGQDVWVVGTGPSMRVLPPQALRGRITLGLNQAWKYGSMTYCLTAHPELLQEYLKVKGAPRTQWIVKRKGPMANLHLDDPRFYVFLTEENYELVRRRTPDKLFLGRGIQCTAISLAAFMGARTVFLVGCDMCALEGEHHGHEQHIQFHGLPPDDVYAEYRKWTAKVRRIVLKELGVPVVTVSPFVGVGHAGEDYARLRQELRLPALPPPQDVSTYVRDKADI